jgi:uncharacterized YigZ family protein
LDSFKTIVTPAEGIYKEKGSKFLSFAIPVKDIEEIKDIIKDYRKRFFDARHICYAYMLGAERLDFRANDDGEPSGTAGRPILGQINSREITNVLVIVVRYFGGILLGTGGLITAYREAAADALNQAEILEKAVEEIVKIQFDYLQMNEVMKIIKDSDAHITNQKFDNECFITFSMSKSNYENTLNKLQKINCKIITQN